MQRAKGGAPMASARPDWYGLPTQAVWKAPPAPTDALPRGWSMEGQAQTVLGAVDPGLLGTTDMMQENLLVSKWITWLLVLVVAAWWWSPRSRRWSAAPSCPRSTRRW